jgi:hypothetical protein
MRSQLRVLIGALVAVLALFGGTAAPSLADGGSPGSSGSSSGSGATVNKQPIFDFSDAYYRANGIDPAGLAGRGTGADGLSVTGPAPDHHVQVRYRLARQGRLRDADQAWRH